MLILSTMQYKVQAFVYIFVITKQIKRIVETF